MAVIPSKKICIPLVFVFAIGLDLKIIIQIKPATVSAAPDIASPQIPPKAPFKNLSPVVIVLFESTANADNETKEKTLKTIKSKIINGFVLIFFIIVPFKSLQNNYFLLILPANNFSNSSREPTVSNDF